VRAPALGVFSLSASTPDGDDSRYLRWHQLDHLPQQYSIEGVLHGARWVSTPECRAARPVQSDRLAPVNHVVHYLMSEPVDRTVDEFFALRDRLIEIGRFPERLPNRLVAGVTVVGRYAAASAEVSADVIPFRPNLGAYLVIERAADPEVSTPVPWHDDTVAALLALDGVAGMWTFAPSGLRPDEFSRSGYSVGLLYLDDDPVAVAPGVNRLLKARWDADDAIAPALGAPFVTLRPWTWDEHRTPG
jgi:hypothetical protein